METTLFGTGIFQLSFVEGVLELYTFTHPNENLKWKTIDNGMQRLPNAFIPLLGEQIKFNREIEESEVFDRIIVTVPLGVVRHWDLPDKIAYEKRRAIRELNYCESAKILLKFKSRFWEIKNNITGGASSTDLPIRTIVYPSYYKKSEESKEIKADCPAVLLASYTWANDAAKFAPYTQEQCFDLALSNIVALHGELLETPQPALTHTSEQDIDKTHKGSRPRIAYSLGWGACRHSSCVDCRCTKFGSQSRRTSAFGRAPKNGVGKFEETELFKTLA
ncbi:amine oxidase [Gigaspora margarita]|uniref:Amine oxidase n=1 Tax=Gigaspora margarita TaxID=4874 RepID=A0A8H4ADD6_GIGMA|nr:amine oxidase [Gigaspora margarita]